MDHAVKIILFAALVKNVSCTIAGLTYMDSFKLVPSNQTRRGHPCNPLYWYPRPIPDYCYGPQLTTLPPPTPSPMPIPIPVPLAPMPMPLPLFIPMPPPMHPQMPQSIPIPMPPISPYVPGPAPIGMPQYPPCLLSAPQSPRMEGLVSPEGALNILPFSDVYSDVLEKHKQKMIRRRLQNLLDEYEHYPRRAVRKRDHRKHGFRGWRYYYD